MGCAVKNPRSLAVDWFSVINRLQREGLDHGQLAKEVGVTRRTIGNWANQVCEPPHSRGEMLLDILRSVVRST